jgi:hypothetical protein
MYQLCFQIHPLLELLREILLGTRCRCQVMDKDLQWGFQVVMVWILQACLIAQQS